MQTKHPAATLVMPDPDAVSNTRGIGIEVRDATGKVEHDMFIGDFRIVSANACPELLWQGG